MTTHLLCVALLVQAPNASLQGTVRDSETGTPVQGATVELLDGGGQAITDQAGRYVLRDLPAGPRHLKVSGFAYKSRTLHVFVPAQGLLELNVVLAPEPIPLRPLEANVEAEAATRGAWEDDLVVRVGSRTVSQEALRSNPGLAEPDVLEVLGGGSVLIDPEAPNGLHVRGGSSDQNLFTLDGLPIFSPYHGLGQFSAIDADAIDRIELQAGAPAAASGDALSGVVDLRTRRPGTERIGVRGRITGRGARLTADGPVGFGPGFLVSAGWGQPGVLVPSSEDSYVRGRFWHGLTKLEWPLAVGHVRILAFHSDNTLRMPNLPTSPEAGGGSEGERAPLEGGVSLAANQFAWRSSSYGLSWERLVGEVSRVDVQLWYADLDVSADWRASEGSALASSRRSNLGGRFRFMLDHANSRSLVGWSLQRERTEYDVRPLSSASLAGGVGASWLELHAEPLVFAAFAEHQSLVFRPIELLLGVRGSGVVGERIGFAPRLSVRWPIGSSISASAGYARTYQWVQSLRNAESLMDHLFSPDLPIHVGADGVPAARADQFTAAVQVEAVLGLSVGLEAFTRALDGLVLVAPSTGNPFAVDRFSIGSGETWGIGVDLRLQRARYRALATYGFTRIAHEVAQDEYRPGFATTHSVAAAAAYYPTAQLELRSALRLEVGRPTTLMEGPFVWEACSILEGGCEAEGSPQRFSGPLGRERLPPYVRVDLGLRRHWHARLFGREGVVAAFATLSNVLGRRNVLGYVSDATTGELSELPMRAFSPLTVGLDWRF